ncbi:hypothetical protein [Sphaerotilus mobilis]|uniref:hypothetical protein n=1 Tax=Sphaerotilus mobilis TaxID=47994 RepID=UPI0013EE5839|nr:hypothetical protein [Sphaerotilus mobilis]
MGWAVCLLQIGLVQAQSIDIASARARVGSPIEVVMRVRAADLEPGAVLQRCVQASVFHGQDTGSVTTLRVSQASAAGDGEVWLTLVDEEPVREPVVRVRAALLCGARYTREFTLLVDPPPDGIGLTRELAGDPGIATGAAPSPAAAASGSDATPAAAGSAALTVAPAPRVRRAAAAPKPAAAAAPKGTRVAQAPALAAAAVVPSVTSAQAAAAMTAAVDRLHQQLESMRDEQRRSQEALLALQARLDEAQQERDRVGESAGTMQVALYAILGALGLLFLPRALGLAWQFGRAGLRGRRDRTSDARDTTLEELLDDHIRSEDPDPPSRWSVSRWAVSASPSTWDREALSPRDPLADAARDRQAAVSEMPVQPKVSTRTYMPVPQVLPAEEPDFDPDGLDETRHAQLLEKIDAIAAEGAPGASATLLEAALKGRIGRSPGIYLRLLDHYRQLGQPGNVERVLGDLCAFYNVRADLDDADGHEGPSLEQHPDIWPAIRDAWHAHGVSALLAAVIRRPSFHTPLSLAAFRDAVWLYAVARVRDEASHRPSDPARDVATRFFQPMDVVN